MPSDYKGARNSRRKRRGVENAPGWIWMLVGLGIGLCVALVVYLRDRPDVPVPASTVVSPASDALEESAEGPDADRSATRFDFYEMLPKFEVVIPETEREVRPDTAPAAVASPGAYVLQAGSFASYADADRRKAGLALQGIESAIQKVTIDNKTYHRVRIGPVTNLDELNDLRNRLRDAEIEVLVIRVGE
ncbi:MAG: SPOR domain-containing protein [Gammaproteobacteria bacterium]|nr:SPOR domain-containing protein [Gammaproteobacteria bacterium]